MQDMLLCPHAVALTACLVMSDMGKRAFADAMALQGPWAAGLAKGISAHDVETTIKVLRSIREKLEINAELLED